jgi:peptide/nickel transport system substrate-binding protein
MKLLVAGLAISLFSMNASAKEGDKRIVYGETVQIDNLNPFTSHELAAQRISDLLFDSLVEINDNGDYLPSLAESWKIEDGGMKITFTLRKKVNWHNPKNSQEKGLPFTAQDVVTTVRILTAKDSEVPNRERFDAIKEAIALSDDEVVVLLDRAMASPLKILAFKILPHSVLKDVPSLKRNNPIGAHPIGTGIYQFASANKEGEIQLKANPFYFKGPAKIPEIVMKSYLDQSVMAQSLMFQSLDLIPYVSPKDLTEIKGDQKLGVVPYEALSFSFFAINNQRGILKNKRIRQALNYAINRKEMLDAFFAGNGTLISGPFPPTSWAYNLDVKPYPFDLERAQALLTEAGLTKGTNGKFHDASGQPVVLNFAVPIAGESEMVKRIVLAFQNYLGNLGITTELEFMDWQVWKKRVLEDHNYDLTIASWNFDDANNITSLFHSSSAKAWGNNFVMFQNEHVDALLTEANFTADSDKKMAIYKKLHAILADESPYVFLWTLRHHAAYGPKISSVKVNPYYFFKDISNWEMKF